MTIVGKGCVNCRWWGAGDKPIIGFDEGDRKFCGRFVYGQNSLDNQAYLQDGDYASSNGSLWTQPNFVCSMWEKS